MKNINIVNIVCTLIFIVCFIYIENINILTKYINTTFKQFLILLVILSIIYKNKYIGTLCFILFIIQYKISYKEFYENNVDILYNNLIKLIDFSLDTKNPQIENIQSMKQQIYNTYFRQNEKNILLELDTIANTKDPII